MLTFFLSYQWTWHQQRWKQQWRGEQWWKWCACSSMQQRRRGCGSKQRACVRQQAAADGGMIAMDGRQPACVRQWAADAACMQQHAAAAACVQQRVGAAGSTIEMGYSDGSGQLMAQLRWAAAVAMAQRTAGRWKIAMNNDYSDGQLWVKAGVGGRSG